MSDFDIIGMIFFGACVLAGAICWKWSRILQEVRWEREEKCTMLAEGDVVELIRRKKRIGSVYCPVVEFQAQDKVIRVRSGSGSCLARYAVGERVQIHYDPEKPTRFYIEGDWSRRREELLFLCGGGAIALIGGVITRIVLR